MMNGIFRRSLFAGTMSVSVLALAACGFNAAGEPRYCEANPEVCALAALVIVGGIVAASDSGGGGVMNGGGGGVGNASDPRLKTDVTFVRQLENGLNLYAFRYIGQEEAFVGVMADEVLRDARYADAVSTGPGGYLVVDYGRLPVQTTNMEAMQRASAKVLDLF